MTLLKKPTEPITSKVAEKHPLVKANQVCPNLEPNLFHGEILHVMNELVHSHLLPNVWHWNCHYLFNWHVCYRVGIWTPIFCMRDKHYHCATAMVPIPLGQCDKTICTLQSRSIAELVHKINMNLSSLLEFTSTQGQHVWAVGKKNSKSGEISYLVH